MRLYPRRRRRSCCERTEEDFERKEIVLIQWNELVSADDAAAAAHRQTRTQVVQILVGVRPPSSACGAAAAAYRRRSSSSVGYRALTLDSFVCVITLYRPSLSLSGEGTVHATVCSVDSRGPFRISRHHVPLSTKVNNKHTHTQSGRVSVKETDIIQLQCLSRTDTQ